MDVAAADPDSAEARRLVARLDAALAAITGDSGASSFDANDVRSPGAVFLVARDAQGAAVGCGALRRLDGAPSMRVGEIKRMYAQPGSGAGAHLLAALERHALACGYQALWLSTRRVNTRAVDFYRRHGYRDVAPYGRYVGREVGRNASICLGRSLADGSIFRRA